MSDETETEVKVEALPEEPAPTQMYAIHSMARSRTNRTERAQLPSRARFKQHIGNEMFRLVRGRPIVFTEAMLLANLDELKEKAAGHVLKVCTLDGRDVDLETLTSAAPPVEEPKPNFPMDSIANDKPWGIKMEPYGGDLDPNAMPGHVLAEGAKPSLLAEVREEEEASPEIPPPAPEMPQPPVTVPEPVASVETPDSTPEAAVDPELDAALAARDAEAPAEEPAAAAPEEVTSPEEPTKTDTNRPGGKNKRK